MKIHKTFWTTRVIALKRFREVEKRALSRSSNNTSGLRVGETGQVSLLIDDCDSEYPVNAHYELMQKKCFRTRSCCGREDEIEWKHSKPDVLLKYRLKLRRDFSRTSAGRQAQSHHYRWLCVFFDGQVRVPTVTGFTTVGQVQLLYGGEF